MNLPMRALFKNVCAKQVSPSNFIFNEIRLNCTQYHTLNSFTKSHLENYKCNKLLKRDVSLMSNLKFGYINLTMKLKELYLHRNDYLPLIGGSNLGRLGFLWYKSLDEVNVEEFINLLEMPDTFFSRVKVIELHVWMLLSILPRGNRRERCIRHSFLIAMWEDHQNRGKMVHKFNLNFKANLTDLYKKFQISIMLYDLGYMESDISLANAVWYNFFSKENVDPRYIEALVVFIRHQMHHLNGLNIEKLEQEVNKKGIWLPVQPHVNEILKKV